MKSQRTQEPWTDELGWRLEQKSDGQDTVCHAYDFEDPDQAFDFVITLCQIAKERQQNPGFRVRDGRVVVQCAIPDEGADEGLRRFITDLNDQRDSLSHNRWRDSMSESYVVLETLDRGSCTFCGAIVEPGMGKR